MGVMSYVASIVDATLRPVLQKLQNDTLFVSGVLGLVNTGIAVGAARLFLMGCKVSLGTLALPQLIALNLATYVALRFFNKADDATPYLCCMFWR